MFRHLPRYHSNINSLKSLFTFHLGKDKSIYGFIFVLHDLLRLVWHRDFKNLSTCLQSSFRECNYYVMYYVLIINMLWSTIVSWEALKLDYKQDVQFHMFTSKKQFFNLSEKICHEECK